MVNANELRIGNWVIFNNELESINVQLMSMPKDWDNSCFYPIPLTPEILEKCGFVYDRMDKEYDIVDHFYIDKQFNIYYKVWEGSDDRGGLEPRVFRTIQSLHQLQNLYFALTGDELVVKL